MYIIGNDHQDLKKRSTQTWGKDITFFDKRIRINKVTQLSCLSAIFYLKYILYKICNIKL